MQDRFLRFREVQTVTGLSKSTIRRQERAGLFPRRRRIGVRVVGWLESEVAAWMQSCPQTAETAAAEGSPSPNVTAADRSNR